MSAGALKTILVAALLAAGVVFLANGLGVEIPVLKYEKLEAYGVPAGISLLVAGVLLAVFWKVSRTETRTTTTTETKTTSDGESSTTTTTSEKVETITTMAPPTQNNGVRLD